jgi:hypothetical protein
MKSGIAGILACVGALSLAETAMAADIYTPMAPEAKEVVTESGWTYTVAPYFWAAGIEGEVAQFGLPTVDVNVKFSDLLDHLDFGAMAIGEARRDRYSIFGDIMYVKISGEPGTPRGIFAQSVDVSAETFTGLLGAGYTVLEGSSGKLDVAVGARVWSVSTDISINGGILGGVSGSDSATWVDAVGGLRGTYSFTPKIYTVGWGLVGAGEADLDWDVAGGVGYRFTDKVSAVLGYRALGVNYSNNDGFVFDVVEHGPILGLAVRW